MTGCRRSGIFQGWSYSAYMKNCSSLCLICDILYLAIDRIFFITLHNHIAMALEMVIYHLLNCGGRVELKKICVSLGGKLILDSGLHEMTNVYSWRFFTCREKKENKKRKTFFTWNFLDWRKKTNWTPACTKRSIIHDKWYMNTISW